ncbi:MAG: metallopeptidase TldD-related protein [Pseudomonadota bacterium]
MTAEQDDRAPAERLLHAALAAGAAEADVIVATASAASVGVAQRALEEAEREETREIGVRVIVETAEGRSQACVAAADLADATIAEMAERAVAMARAAPADPYCGLAPSAALSTVRDAADLDLLDPAMPPDPAALEADALALEDAALAVPGVVQVSQASAGWSRERLWLMQSNGFEGGYARSSASLGLTAIAGAGLGRERDYAFEVRRHRADLPSAAEIGRRAGERTVARLDPQRPPAGHCPVVFDERVAGSLVAHVLGAINGASIARGASWLAEAMGERILPAGLSITEHPHLSRGRASRPFDAEGLATAERALVEDGVLASWVMDLATGRQLGLDSTANARRGLGGPPSPGTGNVRLTQGEGDVAALCRQIGRGLLVTDFLGASINATTGAWSRGAAGFWIERGEIVHPVNEITLAGSLPEMVRTIVPAADADPAKALQVPSLIVEGLTLGA